MRTKKTSKILSCSLILSVLLSMLPVTAFAVEDTAGSKAEAEQFQDEALLMKEVVIPDVLTGAAADGDIQIDETNFPDDKFRAYVKTLAGGEDGIFTVSDIENITKIECASKYISDFTGIEHFTALTTLDCSYNYSFLTSLDVSKNTELTTLNCEHNELTELDVSRNVNLTKLNCSSNKLTELDVSKNTQLKSLDCSDNKLTELDVSQNTALETYLGCGNNQLTHLDVSQTKLKEVDCRGNQLSVNCDATEFNVTTKGFDSDKVVKVTEGGTFEDGSFHFKENTLSYEYNCGKNLVKTFKLVRAGHRLTVDPDTGIHHCENCDYQTAHDFQIKIGDVTVLEDLSQTTKSVDLSAASGLTNASGKMEWNEESNTLTLDEISLNAPIYVQKKDKQIGNLFLLTICLKGKNSITANYGLNLQTPTTIAAEEGAALTVDASVAAISLDAGGGETFSLDITGGVLDLKNKGSIIAGDVAIEGNAKVSIQQTVSDLPGILATGNLTVGDEATVHAQGKKSGVHADQATVSDSAEVSLLGREAYGILTSKLTMNGGELHAEGNSGAILVNGKEEHLVLAEGYADTNGAKPFSFQDENGKPRTMFSGKDVEKPSGFADSVKKVTLCKHYSLTTNLNGGDGISVDGSYLPGAEIEINAGRKAGYTFDGWISDAGGTFADASKVETTFTMPSNAVIITANWHKKSSGGGNSSGGGSTITNPDGSTTTTKKDPVTGTVTEITKYPDGTIGTVETDKNGNVIDVEIDISDQAVQDSKEEEKPVKLPIQVPVASDTEKAPEIDIGLPEDAGTVEVEIPAKDTTAGTVGVIVNPDGTETVVVDSIVTEEGVRLNLDGSVILKLVDRSRYFSDVHPVGHWAKEAIDFVTARNIAKGTSDTHFTPDGSMTRGMLVTMLYNLEGRPELPGENLGYPFSDVKPDDWYAAAVYWAAQNDIVSGYGDGTFLPNQPGTREQLTLMLWNYSGKPKSNADLSHFSDESQISSYASDAMKWAYESGIIRGYNGCLAPRKQATRAEAAQMIKNLLEQNK